MGLITVIPHDQAVMIGRKETGCAADEVGQTAFRCHVRLGPSNPATGVHQLSVGERKLSATGESLEVQKRLPASSETEFQSLEFQ